MVTIQERDFDRGQARAQYLYQEEDACDLQLSNTCDIDDTYIATQQDGKQTEEASGTKFRQTNIEKALAKDNGQYDENHYALARNSGISCSFSKLLADTSDKPDQPFCLIRTNNDKNVPKATEQEHQCNINVNINVKGTPLRHAFTVTLILMVLSLGGVLPYLMTAHLGI